MTSFESEPRQLHHSANGSLHDDIKVRGTLTPLRTKAEVQASTETSMHPGLSLALPLLIITSICIYRRSA